MSFDWQSLVRTVAPALGAALGGPLGGLAARTITGVLLGEETQDEQALSQALQTASPDQLLALKKADQDFAVHLREMDVDIERIAAQDRDSARKRESDVRDRVPGFLAFLVVAGFFGVLACLLAYGTPSQGGEALLVILGALSSGFAAVLAYYFGSSAGSKQKTDLLAQSPIARR
ncbi:MAG: hypothetical protein IPI58_04275 [Alphaproteobacteria bacterium]|nr:MAG: hypothetical protein IPI58_04275 [Alphaproteobacteria bacterium]